MLTIAGWRALHASGCGAPERLGHVVMLCGRYEGVDERVRRHLATEALSIGDYVLSGGELPALVIAGRHRAAGAGRGRGRRVGGA